MQPLHALLTASKLKSQPINWNDDALAAFNATKEALANASLLYYPAAAAPTCLVTDASNTAVGAVLQQYVNGTWHPISFFSRKMTPAETRYSTFDRELLAVYLAIKHFRHFLEGRHFHVLTDHKPLTFALNTRSDRHSPRQARQLDYISQFTSTIRHVHVSRLMPYSLVNHPLWTLLLWLRHRPLRSPADSSSPVLSIVYSRCGSYSAASLKHSSLL